jgi:hypothetical protein
MSYCNEKPKVHLAMPAFLVEWSDYKISSEIIYTILPCVFSLIKFDDICRRKYRKLLWLDVVYDLREYKQVYVSTCIYIH